MPNPNLQADRDIARRLDRTWPAFFQRFGRLTPVQRSAIPPILDGASILIASATASGKTEAACAPLLERNLARAGPATILYVSPTRALVNDLYERLTGPCHTLSARLARRTGEHKSTLNGTPDVLITTPESLDSLLCRGRTPDGHALAHTRNVVLDEIHLLDGTARGEHVRWLLERLRRIRQQAKRSAWTTDDTLQIVALSATVATPELVRDRFLPGGTCLVVPGHREIDVTPPPPDATDLVTAVTTHLQTTPTDRKVILFCNARRQVDDLTRVLREHTTSLDLRIHAHHGSLAQRDRETAETDLKSDARVLVVATSTLEIGIDVGNIDLVILNGPAPDVPALLQRIGRGNRRTGTTRVMPWANTPAEDLIHNAMLAAARTGTLNEKETGPHYGVIRQQLASYVFQARQQRRSKASLERLYTALDLADQGNSVLMSMIHTDELEPTGDGLGLGSAWRDATTSGEIHSTIERPSGNLVVDAAGTGIIASGVKYRGGRSLGVGGHSLNVERVNHGRVEVRRSKDRTDDAGEWSYVSGPWFEGAGQPQALKAFLNIPTHEWPVLTLGTQHLVFHLGGSRRRALLQLLDSPTLGAANGWFAVLSHPLSEAEQALRRGVPRGSLRSRVAQNLTRLERTLGRPHSNARLPEDVRIDDVIEWLAVDKETEAWGKTILSAPTEPRVESALRAVVTAVSAPARTRRS